MPIAFACPQCGHQGSVPDEFQGKQIRCKKCGTASSVPMARPKPPPLKLAAPAVSKSTNFPPPQLTKKCSFCGGLLPESAERCHHCQEMLLVIDAVDDAPVQVIPIERTKACNFCGERILEVARKCKHCGEVLDPVLRAAEEGRRLAELKSQKAAPTYITVEGGSATASASASQSSCGGCLLVVLLAVAFLFLLSLL